MDRALPKILGLSNKSKYLNQRMLRIVVITIKRHNRFSVVKNMLLEQRKQVCIRQISNICQPDNYFCPFLDHPIDHHWWISNLLQMN